MKKLGDICIKHYMVILSLILLLSFVISLIIGRYAISPGNLVKLVYAEITGTKSGLPPASRTAFFVIRLPRIIGAMFIGGGLAAAGAVFQGVFKNPMSSPDILGSSAGAGLGAAIGILLSFSTVATQFMSCVGGLLAVLLTCWIGYMIEKKNVSPITLVLTGMVVTGIFQSGVSLTKYVADPDNKLPAITYWLLGTFSDIDKCDMKMIVCIMVITVTPMILFRWKLSVLAMGDEEASTMGINTGFLRALMIVCSTLITSTTVAFCGMIGWIGLVIPHLARMITGANYVKLLPAAILLGASFTLVVDNIARSLLSMEVPIGILTSLIGAPFFLYLLKKGKRGWN
jgi:iron complex transport system permease protein